MQEAVLYAFFHGHAVTSLNRPYSPQGEDNQKVFRT